jgi:lysophospholipase L1-like esterase
MRYLALGDSYTIGEGVGADERWPEQLAALLRAQGMAVGPPEIVARTGWTTGELMAGIDRAAPSGRFDLVSLLIGVNDQYRGVDPAEYRVTFRAVLERAVAFARGEATRVIVLSVPDWSVTPFAQGRDRARIASEIDRFNAVNRHETTARGARYVDITQASRAAPPAGAGPRLAPDGLHPSGEMYAVWARLVLPNARLELGRAGR